MKLHKENMYKLLRENKILVSKFCKDFNLSEYQFHHYMNGRNIPMTLLQDIADYFDCSIYDITKFKGFDY